MAARIQTDCEGFHRRDFLKLGTAGLLGVSLADLLRLEAQSAPAAKSRRKAKSVVMVWLAGGPATIDMWDLKPEAPEGIRGEFKSISTSAPGVQISEHLPKLAKVMDQCTLVRSLNHNIPAHGPGTVYLTTGNKPTPALEYPTLGSLAAKVLAAPPGLPSYVSFSNLFPGSAGYLGSAYAPFEVEGNPARGQVQIRGVSLPTGFSAKDLERRESLRRRFDAGFRALDQAEIAASLDKFQQQALDILHYDKTNRAFEINREPSSVRESYGQDPFGQGTLVARRLIEAGVRFVTIGTGGWDTHGGNFQALRNRLLPQLDRTLAALLGDLKSRGLLESTIVYCAGEFGRTPQINGGAGRDHWARSMAVLVAGAGLRKGYVHGSTDREGMVPASEPCTPDDVSATVFHCLGIEPNHELQTTSGRPIAVFREGKVISEMLA